MEKMWRMSIHSILAALYEVITFGNVSRVPAASSLSGGLLYNPVLKG